MSDRGFITWMPRGEVAQRLDMIRAVLAEYDAYLPLTMRQVFYRAVGQYGYDKTEQAYKRLLYTAAKARRAGLLDFSHVRDDGVTVQAPHGFAGLADFEDAIKDAAKRYSRERQSGQSRRIILLCEAAGMVPQMARVAHEYGVEVRSSGGYDSVTAKYELATHIVQLDMPVVLLHLGDLDPSGEDIFTTVKEDVGAFVRQLTVVDGAIRNGTATMQAVRVAVTREQAERMELPSAPPKSTDSRTKNFEGETVQCEAIPPDALNDIVRAAIISRFDMDAFNANLIREAGERERIAAVMDGISFAEAT